MGTHDLSAQPRPPALSVGTPLELGVGSGLRKGEGGGVLGLQGCRGSIPASGAGVGTVPIAEGGKLRFKGEE